LERNVRTIVVIPRNIAGNNGMLKAECTALRLYAQKKGMPGTKNRKRKQALIEPRSASDHISLLKEKMPPPIANIEI
jgi:hypothetical protein